MMTYAANDVVLGRHLDTAEKRIKREIDKIAAGGASGVILDTVPASTDGGLWYNVTSGTPVLNLRYGDFAYKFTPDSSEFVGSISESVAAYLPLTPTTEDEKGNEWTLTGTSDSRDERFYFNKHNWLTNQTISDSIGLQPWAVDFWATATEDYGYGHFFGTNNLAASEAGSIAVAWYHGNPLVGRDQGYPSINLGLALNTPHHYALTYDGTTMRFFVDGVLKHTQTIQVQLSGDFSIGSRLGGSAFCGFISHFRIWRGTARWIEDFTPPQSEDYV